MVKKAICGFRAACRAAVLLVMAAAAACTADPADNRPAVNDVPVKFSIRTAGNAMPRSATRAPGDMETALQTVEVLVFQQLGASYIYAYRVSGHALAGQGNYTSFQASLVSTSAPVRLLLVANCGDAFASYTPSSGEPEAVVRHHLACAYDPAAAALPMYGEIALESGIDATQSLHLTATMLRAAAKVDVIRQLDGDLPGFEMTSLYAFRPNTEIQIIPDAANIASGSSPSVAAPSVPATAVAGDYTMVGTTSNPDSLGSIYIPEAVAVTDPAKQIGTPTCLVVGGKFNGSEQITYYRIDFNSGLEGHPFGQVLRNYRYEFRIRRVLNPGWDTPEEAANNAASGMVAQVQAWQDFTTEMFCGDENDYLGVSSRSMTLRYRKSYSDTLSIQSTVPFSVELLDSGGNTLPVAALTTANLGQTGSNSFCSFTLKQGPQNDVYYLIATSAAENRTAASYAAGLRISYGTWSFPVNIVQETFAKYSNRIINVLGIPSTYGSLGDNYGNYSGAACMLPILNNTANFSPTGTVTINRFSYYTITNNSYQGTMATSASDLAAVKAYLNSQDVIYFTYSTKISTGVASLVIDWLNGSRNRVLMIGVDESGTCANLMTQPKVQADGVWKYGMSGIYYNTPPANDDNAPFISGIFGAVEASATGFSVVDGTLGYCSAPASSVTPILNTFTKAGGLSANMVIGVNKNSRIVYQGDASIFTTTAYGTTGSLTNDYTRLLANLWAWIAEQVVWED